MLPVKCPFFTSERPGCKWFSIKNFLYNNYGSLFATDNEHKSTWEFEKKKFLCH